MDLVAELRQDEERAVDALLVRALALDALMAEILVDAARIEHVRPTIEHVRAELRAAHDAVQRARQERHEADQAREESGVDTYLPVSQAAAYYGISRQTLHSAIRAGRLASQTRMERGKKTTYVRRTQIEALAGR